MRKCLVTLTTILLFTYSSVFALHRDYKSDCEEDNRYQFYYQPYCLNHTPGNYQEWLSSNLAKYIPAKGPTCCKCDSRSVYLGYLDVDFRKYRSHLIHQLEFCRKNPKCHCYWSEYSSQAAEISDKAYLLFRDLIATTALSDLLENEDKQKNFIENPGWFLNKHGLTISFIAQQFRFSDYYHICKDIENYAIANYPRKDVAQIKDKLEDMLEALYPKFYSLYTGCHAKHPSDDIEQEIRLMRLLANDDAALADSFDFIDITISSYYDNKSYDVSEFIIANLQTINYPVELESKGVQTEKAFFSSTLTFTESLDLTNTIDINTTIRAFSIQSEILIEQGTILNSLLLYKKAIEVLSKAIKLNSSNPEAYLERAIAYFEINQIKLALKDYERAKQLATPPFKAGVDPILRSMYIPKHKIDFAEGLIKGVLSGAHVPTKEMIPSILSCCRGILHGLWAFASSPSDVSQEMIDIAYAIGEYIKTHNAIECVECVVPEFMDLSSTWHRIDDYSKGKKIGYMIGKYGVEIFAPLGAIKGIAKYKVLKRANAELTFARCAESQSTQKRILEKSVEFAAKREVIIKDAARTGSILIKTENVVHHVMQKHHHWEKVIELTADIKNDFKKVLKFIDDNKIVNKDNIKRTFKHKNQSITVETYSKNINGHEVYVHMETYLERGETFLKNAYVEIH